MEINTLQVSGLHVIVNIIIAEIISFEEKGIIIIRISVPSNFNKEGIKLLEGINSL